MNGRSVRDLMIPLSEYPIVNVEATVMDAVLKLEESRRTASTERSPFLAVLVADQMGNIVGKLGQLALLQALEPESHVARDQGTLDRAGVSRGMMHTAFDHFRVLRHNLSDLCQSAATLPVRTVMHAVTEHIDIGSSVYEVIHQMVAWQTLSLLVTENDRPVGLIRLSEVCDEVIRQMHTDSSAGAADGDANG